MINEIKYNNWTGTYYIYRSLKPTQLRKNVTTSMKQFMENATKTESGYFTIYRKGTVK